TGIALDAKNGRIFTVCRENKGMSVVDIHTGKVITTVPIGAGVDAVIYDEPHKLIFVSNGDATTTIIKQESPDKYAVIQTLATKTRAKTMAFDAKTRKIYLSAPTLNPARAKPCLIHLKCWFTSRSKIFNRINFSWNEPDLFIEYKLLTNYLSSN